MSAERDELTEIIQSPESFDGGSASCGPNAVFAARTADAILAAGYRKPQQVTTVRELHALPTDAVIRTVFGAVFVKDGGWWAETGTRDKSLSADLDLPVTVLHRGTE